MRLAGFVCAVLGALLISAQSSGQQLLDVGGKDPLLAQTWHESEGGWIGAWTPANPTQLPGDFIANFSMGREHANARLHISISGQIVQVTRTQPNGQHCNYRGTLNAARTVVTGSYSCDWARQAMPWRASIGAAATGAPSDRPDFQSTGAYLAYPWIEREGAWRGRWTPHTPGVADGHFDAHFAMNTESARADLMITVEEHTGVVHVTRTDPGGRVCNYVGQVSGNVLDISGHYNCGGDHASLPWSAHVETGAHP